MQRTNRPSILSPRRITLALIALALGGFGIGANEFVTMGLLPELARDLLPEAYMGSHEAGNAQAGWLITVYALGVVLGAPTIAAATARRNRKTVLLVLLGVFVVGTAASAIAHSFEMVLLARFIAGLPHGAYFGIAALVAASLLGPDRRALGAAIVIGGLTIANVVGVPAITWFGQNTGWRPAYLVVAAIFGVAMAAVALAVPSQPGDSNATIKNELSVLRRRQVWLALGMGAIGFGGLFAMYSYIAPLAENVTGVDPVAVPLVLVVIGVGMTTGNLLGGWAADRSVRRATYGAFGVLLVGLVLLLFTVSTVTGLIAAVFLVGTGAAALGPTIQTRLMDVARGGQAIAAALNHSAFNIGNAMGAALGGLTLAAGFGYIAPIVVGLLLAAAGTAVAVASFAIDRVQRQRGVDLPYGTATINLPKRRAV